MISTPSNKIGAVALDLGFIRASGPDAETFLDAQLARRVPRAADRLAPLAGWHDAQGRVRALFRVLPVGADWLLAAPASSASEALAALGRYVLRAKVELSEANAHWAAAALIGRETVATLGAEPGTLAAAPPLYRVRLGPALQHVFGPPAALAAWLAERPALTPEAAALAEIELGLPRVTPAVANRYLAQMLNLDLLGAVSFDKGCYPGQEVITRSASRGTVKRRMRRFRAPPGTPLPALGARVLDAAGEDAGEVVGAAGAERLELLAVVRLERLGAGLGLEDGTPLERLPLPYENEARLADAAAETAARRE